MFELKQSNKDFGIIMIRRIGVKNFDEYLINLNKRMNDSIMWIKLQEKNEYGTDRSEKGYQQIAAINVRNAARNLGLSEDKSELFVKILGSYFPQYGAEGKQCIMEFLDENGMHVSEPELASDFVENNLQDSEIIIAKGLKGCLLELFNFDKNSGENEIELAKLYHEMTEVLKLYYSISREKYSEIEKNFNQNAIDNIKNKAFMDIGKRLKKY